MKGGQSCHLLKHSHGESVFGLKGEQLEEDFVAGVVGSNLCPQHCPQDEDYDFAHLGTTKQVWVSGKMRLLVGLKNSMPMQKNTQANFTKISRKFVPKLKNWPTECNVS